MVLRQGWTWMPITEMKSRTALLGGTFDPVHLGHVHLFHEAYSRCGITHLIVIPAYISNFKRGTHPASFEHRVNMLGIGADDFRKLYPDDCEHNRNTPVRLVHDQHKIHILYMNTLALSGQLYIDYIQTYE